MSSRPARRSRTAPRRHQAGVALITAVLIVALATILAVSVGFKGYLDQRRSATLYSLDQGYEIGMGAEGWAADILRKDQQGGSKTDDFTEAWATPMPPIPVDGGEVVGQLEDMQGRFNLNTLVKMENGVLVADKAAVQRFKNLLQILELEDKWADIIADWLDTDGEAGFPDGAEDNVYTSLQPPYRTPNLRITRPSEVLAIAGMDLAIYRKLAPFISALPADTPINLCTASPEVLDSLTAGTREFTQARDNTAELRKQRCYPSLQDFKARLSPEQQRELESVIGESSSYFRANIWVTIGTTQFTLYSLLYRANGTHLVRPILRSFGTD